jgi:hypothetical protein
VGRQVLDVDDHEAVLAQEERQAGERVEEHVLVVNRVELEAGDEVAHVRRLEDEVAALGQENLDTSQGAVDVGHVGENVVGVDHVGSDARRPQGPGHVGTEELGEGGDAPRLGPSGEAGRRFDAQHGHAHGLVVLQEVAVVAPDLRDQAVLGQAVPGGQLHRQLAHVGHEGV